MHLGELPSNAAGRFGPREALVFGEDRWTFAEFNANVERVARALIATDIRRGDRVAVWMVNRPEWLFTMFALARVGAVIVPLNTRYRADDLHYTLAQSRSATLNARDVGPGRVLVTAVRICPSSWMQDPVRWCLATIQN